MDDDDVVVHRTKMFAPSSAAAVPQRQGEWKMKKWLSKRHWMSAESESTYTSLGVELLCSWAWPMSFIVYAAKTSLGGAWLTGWLLYYVMCTSLVWVNARAVAVKSRDPAVSGASVIVDILFENDDRPRYVSR